MSKLALITGASGGIGGACAEALYKAGCRVVLHYNSNRDAAEALAERLGNARAAQADLTSEADVKRLAELCGDIDILVNCAGIAKSSLFQDINEASWDRMLDTNLKSVYLVTRAFLPAMISRKSGSIVNISSMWGITGASCETSYSASKGAIIALTKALAKEVGPSGIRVNCVAPGCIDTAMLRTLGDEVIADLAEEAPLRRIGTPQDVAEAVAFLALDSASFITGEVLNVSGGFLI